MSIWFKVARYHVTQRVNYVVLPWAVLALAFAVYLAIFGSLRANGVGTHGGHNFTGAVAAIFVFWSIGGLLSTTRSLPFGLALGVTRRSYYLGTIGLGVTLGAVYGLVLAILQAIERASGGWGMRMHFFRVPYLLNGRGISPG